MELYKSSSKSPDLTDSPWWCADGFNIINNISVKVHLGDKSKEKSESICGETWRMWMPPHGACGFIEGFDEWENDVNDLLFGSAGTRSQSLSAKHQMCEYCTKLEGYYSLPKPQASGDFWYFSVEGRGGVIQPISWVPKEKKEMFPGPRLPA